MVCDSISFKNNGIVYLITLSMFYVSLMLCNAILTNRYISFGSSYILGGTLTSPFIFILDDIIAEIYGYNVAKRVIYSGFAAQAFFSLICLLITIMPAPIFFINASSYANILGLPLLKITISGFFAYIVANVLNVYIITRWKILLQGKYFWLRSIGSSGISEGLYTLLAIVMMEVNLFPVHDVMSIVWVSFLLKLAYNVVFAIPANILVFYIKWKSGINVMKQNEPNNFIQSGWVIP